MMGLKRYFFPTLLNLFQGPSTASTGIMVSLQQSFPKGLEFFALYIMLISIINGVSFLVLRFMLCGLGIAPYDLFLNLNQSITDFFSYISSQMESLSTVISTVAYAPAHLSLITSVSVKLVTE